MRLPNSLVLCPVVFLCLLLLILTPQMCGAGRRARLFKHKNNLRNQNDTETRPNHDDRAGRLFSLFNVVTFKKAPCSADIDGTQGLCMSLADCSR